LWNPFLALDIAAPAVISYGFAEPAIAAVIGWMTGAVTPVGSLPVLGFDLG
jgi:beta-N-acetylhexosaminidase